MSALFWSQIKDLTRRVEALEATVLAMSTPSEPAPPQPVDVLAVVPGEVKRGPGRPKKQ